MRYNNKTIQRLHNDQFAPLKWLERLESEQYQFDCQYHPERALSAELNATLAGLETTLKQLDESFSFEERQLFKLIKKAGEVSMLDSLQPRRQRISVLTRQLLDSITAIRHHTTTQFSEVSLNHNHHNDGEAYWDEAALLVPDLSNRLIRYLQAAETDYLPMADYLLGPTADREADRQPAIKYKKQMIKFSVTGAILPQASSQPSQHYH